MALTSDPHAWLRPLWRRLASDAGFLRLAPSLQFDALRALARREHPTAARYLSEINAVSAAALLGHLSKAVESDAARGHAIALWTATRGDRRLQCEALHLPSGLDVRLVEAGEFRRTSLCRDVPAVTALVAHWKARLVEAGWAVHEASDP